MREDQNCFQLRRDRSAQLGIAELLRLHHYVAASRQITDQNRATISYRRRINMLLRNC